MVLVCAIAAWVLTIGGLLTIYRVCKSGIQRFYRLHLVPCSRCQFFTNSCYLKCPVSPHLACTEGAIDCPDFAAALSR